MRRLSRPPGSSFGVNRSAASRVPAYAPGMSDPEDHLAAASHDTEYARELAELEALEALEAHASGGVAEAQSDAVAPPPGGWYPCPACGHQMFSRLWAYEICEVCFWEEDPYQLRHPWTGMGPNGGLSLMEAQANYRRFGAVEEEHVRRVRPPRADEPVDPGWRLADPDLDPFEQDTSGTTPHPDDLATLYYWRPTYWRRHLRPHPRPDPRPDPQP